MGDLVREKAALSNIVGLSEGLLRIAEDVVVVLLQVVRLVVVDKIGLGLHRLFGIEVGGQKLVLDVDQFESLFRDRLRDRSDAGDVIADIAYFVERERVLVMADGKDAEGVGSVLARDHRNHTVEPLGPAGVNALDASMRMRRMQNLSVEHAGEGEVVGIFARAGGFPSGVNHRDGFADDGEDVSRSSVNSQISSCSGSNRKLRLHSPP